MGGVRPYLYYSHRAELNKRGEHFGRPRAVHQRGDVANSATDSPSKRTPGPLHFLCRSCSVPAGNCGRGEAAVRPSASRPPRTHCVAPKSASRQDFD